jgi:hypothetical protein
MACDAEKATLTSLQNRFAELEEIIKKNPAGSETEQPELDSLTKQIVAAQDALNKCMAGQPQPPQKVPGAQPKEILDIVYQNPAFGGGTSDWGTRIGGGKFPAHQGFEWKQVMDTANEYDETPVGATGWATFQDTASSDFMFLHPFGKDWEFLLALDQAYYNLCPGENLKLATGKDVAGQFSQLGLTQTSITGGEDVLGNVNKMGFLGVEWESGLVPQSFQDGFSNGDRVAVFGRWIIDCGEDFHTEIHPPLLLASASVYKVKTSVAGSPSEYTRVLFTSRAFLAGQNFATGTSTDQIYNDASGDDGHFLGHMIKELAKAESLFGSLRIEAHPKIKQFPFKGPHIFQFIVRTSEPSPIVVTATQHLVVSFHFTIRTGCAVEVTANDNSSVRVFVTINSVGYTPPPLPKRNDLVFSLEEINNDLNLSFGYEVLGGLAGILNIVADPKGAAVIARGVLTDSYTPLPDVAFSHTSSSDVVLNASPGAIPAGKGITVDNNQPYPITGWVEVGYAQTVLVNAPVASGPVHVSPIPSPLAKAPTATASEK